MGKFSHFSKSFIKQIAIYLINIDLKNKRILS